jgi:crotonobetainyl-CoA:carnitine CoA-transferase CaiB-like acyl-CoA transferase
MPARVAAWAVYRIFETADNQQVFIGITSDKHWQSFCDVFGREDLATREELKLNNQRVDARDWLQPELEKFFKTLTKAEIIEKADKAQIPFAPIARPEDLFEDPQLNEGGSLVDVTLPDERVTKLPKLPMYVEGDDFGLRLQAPSIGEHTRELMVEIGYNDEQITKLMNQHVIV